MITVEKAGALTTVQDRGRTGLAHLGVPRAGPLDPPAAALANRLVGNGPDAALLEVTWGGLELTSDAGVWVAVTGAPTRLDVDGVGRGLDRAEWLPPAGRLRLGVASSGRAVLRRGRGRPRRRSGARLPLDRHAGLGGPAARRGRHDAPGRHSRGPAGAAGHTATASTRTRCGSAPDLGRTGSPATRSSGSAPRRTSWGRRPTGSGSGSKASAPRRVRDDELPSEGMVLGSVQVPPGGQPVVFLADHPPTGGYPVLAVVHPDDLWQCGQARPGEELRFVRG